MSWESPQPCKICGTTMRDVGFHRPIWHCDRCEDRYSAIEDTSESTTTKPLFEDWWQSVQKDSQLYYYDVLTTVLEVGHKTIALEFNGVILTTPKEVIEANYDRVIPIPRASDQTIVAALGTSASSRQLRTLPDPVVTDIDVEAGYITVELRPDLCDAQKQKHLSPESALPDRSSTPNRLYCSVCRKHEGNPCLSYCSECGYDRQW